MTGAFVCIKRNGKWDAIEIDELSEKEINKFAYDMPLDGWKWAMFLVKWIQENVQKEDIYDEYE